MGSFDDALKQAAPGGDLSNPLLIALNALLGGSTSSPQPNPAQPRASAPPPPPAPAAPAQVINGLDGLLATLQNAGLGDVVKSWVGTGANMPVKPADLKSALGEKAVTNIAGQAGVSENDLLAQLSKALPGVVDKFTPNGRIPSLSEITDLFRQK